ncbi:MAG TPA: type IV pilus modification protein PilV [Steroidobacteraceae bacterium]|nr:type IV pilus modification protein PilV [Steroidobacteraceae bacterium]
MQLSSAGRFRHRSAGFSLVEVMVALVVVAVGLLGLAKMESLALSSTSVAGSRSIAAIQASSLAAAMHANPGYWAAGAAPATTSISHIGGVLTITDPGLRTAATCLTAGTASCVPGAMAAYDVQQWAAALNAVLPGYLATVNCTVTVGIPVTCTIQIQWSENAVAGNSKQTNMAGLNQPTYTLFVQP